MSAAMFVPNVIVRAPRDRDPFVICLSTLRKNGPMQPWKSDLYQILKNDDNIFLYV